jgi:hypothetical protein
MGMIERGSHLRLALKTAACGGIRQIVSQKLHGDRVPWMIVCRSSRSVDAANTFSFGVVLYETRSGAGMSSGRCFAAHGAISGARLIQVRRASG